MSSGHSPKLWTAAVPRSDKLCRAEQGLGVGDPAPRFGTICIRSTRSIIRITMRARSCHSRLSFQDLQSVHCALANDMDKPQRFSNFQSSGTMTPKRQVQIAICALMQALRRGFRSKVFASPTRRQNRRSRAVINALGTRSYLSMVSNGRLCQSHDDTLKV
jgi:sulfur relay (sulfurtransferase) complex TusBCD TusD component (DsrE family)